MKIPAVFSLTLFYALFLQKHLPAVVFLFSHHSRGPTTKRNCICGNQDQSTCFNKRFSTDVEICTDLEADLLNLSWTRQRETPNTSFCHYGMMAIPFPLAVFPVSRYHMHSLDLKSSNLAYIIVLWGAFKEYCSLGHHSRPV